MPTYSTGISATWNSVSFNEIQELAWNSGGSMTSRSTRWSADQGQVTITSLSDNNAGRQNFGIRALLTITGGGAALSSYAVWESVSVAPERNGVTRYTVTLKLVDDT